MPTLATNEIVAPFAGIAAAPRPRGAIPVSRRRRGSDDFGTHQSPADRGMRHSRVTFVELFFDLVFVFAVTQLSHGLLEHLTPLGALQTALLMLAMWWAWIDNAWVTNWLDPDRAPVRMLLFALMLAGLVVSSSIPKAFADRGAGFRPRLCGMRDHAEALHAVGAAATTIPATTATSCASRSGAGRRGALGRRRLRRPADARLVALGAGARDRHRLAARRLLGAGPRPLHHGGLDRRGRSLRRALRPVRHHRARRIDPDHRRDLCGLALDRRRRSRPSPIAFVGSVAMWVVYFNIGAERSSRLIAASSDPGRLARSGYTYLHIPIVAGIIVAAVGGRAGAAPSGRPHRR